MVEPWVYVISLRENINELNLLKGKNILLQFLAYSYQTFAFQILFTEQKNKQNYFPGYRQRFTRKLLFLPAFSLITVFSPNP